MPDRDSGSRLQQGMRRRGALHAGESVPDAVARTVAELLTVDTAVPDQLPEARMSTPTPGTRVTASRTWGPAGGKWGRRGHAWDVRA